MSLASVRALELLDPSSFPDPDCVSENILVPADDMELIWYSHSHGTYHKALTELLPSSIVKGIPRVAQGMLEEASTYLESARSLFHDVDPRFTSSADVLIDNIVNVFVAYE